MMYTYHIPSSSKGKKTSTLPNRAMLSRSSEEESAVHVNAIHTKNVELNQFQNAPSIGIV